MNIVMPESSILGPLLFLLHINDLSNSVPGLSHINFADDTNVLRTDTILMKQKLQNVQRLPFGDIRWT